MKGKSLLLTLAVTNLIKQYFTSHLGDSTFSYTVTIQELINLCQANGGTALTATATQAVQCGLISDASKLGDLLNELKGKTISGRTLTPHIFIPYYDTSLFVTPTWDGATVYRVVLNDPYAKQNIGVPVTNLKKHTLLSPKRNDTKKCGRCSESPTRNLVTHQIGTGLAQKVVTLIIVPKFHPFPIPSSIKNFHFYKKHLIFVHDFLKYVEKNSFFPDRNRVFTSIWTTMA